MDQQPNQYIQEDEISLKDLILLVQTYLQECLKFWWIIGIAGLSIGAFFFYRAHKKPITYNASVSYTTSDGAGLGGLAGGLLGRFVGGKSGSSIAKMQAMLTSGPIMQRVLFTKVMLGDQEDYLINHHLRLWGYDEEEFGAVVPLKSGALTSLLEKKLFKRVRGQIQEQLLSQGLDEESGIAFIKVTSSSEEYAFELSRTLFEELQRFYIESEVGEQQKTLDQLQNRADSIYSVINVNTYQLARREDSDKGRFFATDRVPDMKAQAELAFLKSAYEEVVKNLETIKFTVASSTPSIKVIEQPMYPLEKNQTSKLKQLLIGGFLGGFLAVLFIVSRRIFREIMAEDEA